MISFLVSVDGEPLADADGEPLVFVSETDATEAAQSRTGEGVPVTVHAFRHYREPSHRSMVGFRWWNADGRDRFWSVQRDGRLVCGLETFGEGES